MKFALRYYRTLLAGAFRLTRVFMTVSYIYFTASIVISLAKYGFDSSIIFDIVMLFVPVVVVIIAAAVLEIRSYPYLRTLNSCGYCAETLEQFLKIQKGRPMNYKTTLQYTGLLHGMDRTEEAALRHGDTRKGRDKPRGTVLSAGALRHKNGAP